MAGQAVFSNKWRARSNVEIADELDDVETDSKDASRLASLFWVAWGMGRARSSSEATNGAGQRRGWIKGKLRSNTAVLAAWGGYNAAVKLLQSF